MSGAARRTAVFRSAEGRPAAGPPARAFRLV